MVRDRSYMMSATKGVGVGLDPDLLNVQNLTPTGFKRYKIYAKKCLNFVKILIAKN